MKKLTTLLILLLMLPTIGCKQPTPEQLIEKQGKAKMKALEKDGFSQIQKMITDMLKYPESYQPISNDMSIITNNMLIYDSKAFVALRDMHYAIKNFNKKYSDETIPQSAQEELEYIQTMGGVVRDRINAINNLPVMFEGIDVYHQFNVKDHHNKVMKTGYHFIVHKNDQITLLCDQDDFLKVQTLIKQWFDYPSYSKEKPDSLDNYLNMKRERIQQK